MEIRLRAAELLEQLENEERKRQGAKIVNVVVLNKDYTIKRVYAASRNMVADYNEADFSRTEITWADQRGTPRGLTSNLLNKIAEVIEKETENYVILPDRLVLKLNQTILKYKE